MILAALITGLLGENCTGGDAALMALLLDAADKLGGAASRGGAGVVRAEGLVEGDQASAILRGVGTSDDVGIVENAVLFETRASGFFNPGVERA